MYFLEHALKNTGIQKGKIEFRNLCLKYAEADSLVLDNLNFTIKQEEKVISKTFYNFLGVNFVTLFIYKIGIVGRTGAGKSSIIVALFRLAYTDGLILIDGVDTKTIELNALRKQISVIPQEPVLFSATVRYNLDPFDEFCDSELWDALEKVKRKKNKINISKFIYISRLI